MSSGDGAGPSLPDTRFPHLPDETWDAFLGDLLPTEAEARVKRHLEECAGCRASLRAADPTRVFGVLRGLDVRRETWEGFWEGVSARLDPLPAHASQPMTGARRASLAIAGLAAAAVVAVVLLRSPDSRGPSPGLADAGRVVDTVDPCPASVASLRLTRQECEALFGEGSGARPETAEVVLSSTMDLRGL